MASVGEAKPRRGVRLDPGWVAAIRREWPLGLIVVVLLSLITFLRTPITDGADAQNYLAQLHSILTDADLSLADDLPVFGKPVYLTPAGWPFELHNIGAVLFWLPFVVPVHLAIWLAAPAETLQPATPAIVRAIQFATWTYSLLAALLCYRAARAFVRPVTAALATLGLWIGSPILFYTSIAPINNHLPAVFVASLLLLILVRAGDRLQPGIWLGAGILTGLAALLATYNLALGLMPAAVLAGRVWPDRRSIAVWRATAIAAVLLGAGYALATLPHYLMVARMFGRPFASGYSMVVFWRDPHLFETLFSSYHGLVFTAPLILLGIAGLAPFARRRPALALGCGLSLAALLYLMSVNIGWWGGGAFGGRHALALTPVFVIGLAIALERWRPLAAVGVAASIVWTVLLLLQRYVGLRDWFGYHPWPAMLERQWQTIQILAGVAAPHRPEAAAPGAVEAAVTTIAGTADAGDLPALVWIAALGVVALGLAVPRLGRRAATWGLMAVPLVALTVAVIFDQRGVPAARAFVAANPDVPRTEIDRWDFGSSWWERANYRLQLGQVQAAVADYHFGSDLWPELTCDRISPFYGSRLPGDEAIPAGASIAGFDARATANGVEIALYRRIDRARSSLPPAHLEARDPAGRVVAGAPAPACRTNSPYLPGSVVRGLARLARPGTGHADPVTIYLVGEDGLA